MVSSCLVDAQANEEDSETFFGRIIYFLKDLLKGDITGKALLDYGDDCTEDSQCESRNCDNNGHRDVCCVTGEDCCSDDGDCPDGQVCEIQGLGLPDYCVEDDIENPNGMGCNTNYDCQSQHCQNNMCCQSGYTCCVQDSNCPSGYECESDSQKGYICTLSTQPSYCGDDSCGSGETCSSCPYDCGECNGEGCLSDSMCESGNCENEICCSSGKTCCSSDSHCLTGYDCGSSYYCVQSETTSYSNGQSCSLDSECSSGNCYNYVCCTSGKTCCDSDYDCYSELGSGYECSSSYYCISSSSNSNLKSKGELCSSNSECESGNCNDYGNEGYGGACCEYGKKCCYDGGSSTTITIGNSDYYCGYDYYLIETGQHIKSIGDSCSSDSECGSGWCHQGNCDCYDCNGDSICDTPQNSCSQVQTTTNQAQTVTNKPTATSSGVQRTSYEQVTPITGIVVSVKPVGDREGEELKNEIENGIYPAIVEIFDRDSSKVFTGPRSEDKEINLVMSNKETVALWNEGTNTMTIPYASVYGSIGMYDKKVVQYNAIAHELTHYHFNGHAELLGGNYKKIPLWFREGICEYGAHKYYEDYLNIPEKTIAESISSKKELSAVGYLSNPEYQYRDTVEKNAIKLLSWDNQGWDWDEDIEDYALVYYGAVFSFVNYWFGDNLDTLKCIFVETSKNGKFRMYAEDCNTDNYAEEDWTKERWFNNYIEKEFGPFKNNFEERGWVNRWFGWLPGI